MRVLFYQYTLFHSRKKNSFPGETWLTPPLSLIRPFAKHPGAPCLTPTAPLLRPSTAHHGAPLSRPDRAPAGPLLRASARTRTRGEEISTVSPPLHQAYRQKLNS